MNSQILLAKGWVPIGEIFYRPSYEPAKSFPSINAKTSDTKILISSQNTVPSLKCCIPEKRKSKGCGPWATCLYRILLNDLTLVHAPD